VRCGVCVAVRVPSYHEPLYVEFESWHDGERKARSEQRLAVQWPESSVPKVMSRMDTPWHCPPHNRPSVRFFQPGLPPLICSRLSGEGVSQTLSSVPRPTLPRLQATAPARGRTPGEVAPCSAAWLSPRDILFSPVRRSPSRPQRHVARVRGEGAPARVVHVAARRGGCGRCRCGGKVRR